jgi:hypothetical protein
MNVRTLNPALGVAVLATVFVASASAGCGSLDEQSPSLNHASLRPASFLRVSDQESNTDRDHDSQDRIVGLWYEKFVVPDGTVIDFALAQWHSDGTEITNSGGRLPRTSSFCLGVWKKVEPDTYRLNHFAFGFDASGSDYIGIGHIQERIKLSHDGNTFSGTFTIDQYDQLGNVVAHVAGTITGTRLTPDSPPPL